eukprot:TRINITY_DN100723_c0_g1_i1.p1 TRINITY_DN100723_c0_g1~~TRINITY_DN100723_c0_g1_i1.p1  ORF type:complete len:549 (-),score=107.79 TRINITY_DN100723_c0_g1_i1:17-1663(-)
MVQLLHVLLVACQLRPAYSVQAPPVAGGPLHDGFGARRHPFVGLQVGGPALFAVVNQDKIGSPWAAASAVDEPSRGVRLAAEATQIAAASHRNGEILERHADSLVGDPVGLGDVPAVRTQLDALLPSVSEAAVPAQVAAAPAADSLDGSDAGALQRQAAASMPLAKSIDEEALAGGEAAGVPGRGDARGNAPPEQPPPVTALDSRLSRASAEARAVLAETLASRFSQEAVSGGLQDPTAGGPVQDLDNLAPHAAWSTESAEGAVKSDLAATGVASVDPLQGRLENHMLASSEAVSEATRTLANESRTGGSLSDHLATHVQDFFQADWVQSPNKSLFKMQLLGSAGVIVLVVLFLIFDVAIIVYWLNTREKADEQGGNAVQRMVSNEGGRARSRKGAGSVAGMSESSEHFTARLEEITQQLASMLKGPCQVPMSGASGEWQYVAAIPDRKSDAPGNNKWKEGVLGWWDSGDLFLQGLDPLGSVPLLSIADVNDETGNETIVVIMKAEAGQEKGKEIVLKFRAEKEAQLWGSTLSALLEQLEDESDMDEE